MFPTLYGLLESAVLGLFDFIATFFNGLQQIPLIAITFVYAGINLFRKAWRKIVSAFR